MYARKMKKVGITRFQESFIHHTAIISNFVWKNRSLFRFTPEHSPFAAISKGN